MGLKIRNTTRFGENSNVHGESRQAQSRKAILRMLGKKYIDDISDLHNNFGHLYIYYRNTLINI